MPRGLKLGFDWLRHGGGTLWVPSMLGSAVSGLLTVSDNAPGVDSAYVTHAAGAVSQWASTDGLSTWDQSTAGLKPTYNSVYLNGWAGIDFFEDQLVGTGGILGFTNGKPAVTIMMLGKCPVLPLSKRPDWLNITGAGGNPRWVVGIQNTSNPSPRKGYMTRRRLDADTTVSGIQNGNPWIDGDTYIVTSLPKPTDNTHRQKFSGLAIQYDDTSAAGFASSGNFDTTNSTKVGLGDSSWYGTMWEILFCNRELTTAEIQRVEGSWAWKYNLTALLGATHPYKSFPPTV